MAGVGVAFYPPLASTSVAGLSSYNSTNFTVSAAGVANTIQNIATSSTPQFTRLGLGAVADAVAHLKLGTSVAFPGAVTSTANIYYSSVNGLVAYGAGSSYDILLLNKSGNDVLRVATGTVTASMPGPLLLNGTAAYGTNSELIEINTSAAYGGMSLNTWSTTASQASIINFRTSRSATIGTHAIVVNGDALGHQYYYGSNGTSFDLAAYLIVTVDGVPGAVGDMPGRFGLFTSPDGSASPVERVRIDSKGNVGISSSPAFGAGAAGVLSIANGTAPSTGPADTVQFYSSDDAVGHTIPSFYCEGTNVIATGQADVASSVRVKMRINGTVVTLLAV